MVAHRDYIYSEEEYLALERAAERKSEYRAGKIVAMSGASEAHNIITTNLIWQLRNQFEGRPCRVYGSDMRVRVAPARLYTYPDVTAVCGPREFADDRRDTLLNPTVIFEVLSPSTKAYDRGKKFVQYAQLSSLTDYVLLAQDRVLVEHHTRRGDGWHTTTLGSLTDSLHLDPIDATLPLAVIYANVEFPQASSDVS